MVAANIVDDMCARIPKSQMAIIQNAGHLVTGDNPSEFEKAVTEFIHSI